MSEATPALPTSPMKGYFLVPMRIVKDCRLCRLSGYALSLYLYLAHALYKRQKQARLYANSDLSRTLDMPLDRVREARQELRANLLIGYKPFKSGYLYWFNQDQD